MVETFCDGSEELRWGESLFMRDHQINDFCYMTNPNFPPPLRDELELLFCPGEYECRA